MQSETDSLTILTIYLHPLVSISSVPGTTLEMAKHETKLSCPKGLYS